MASAQPLPPGTSADENITEGGDEGPFGGSFGSWMAALLPPAAEIVHLKPTDDPSHALQPPPTTAKVHPLRMKTGALSQGGIETSDPEVPQVSIQRESLL